MRHCLLLCRELVPTADINLVASLMQLLYSLLDEWRPADTAQTLVGAWCLRCTSSKQNPASHTLQQTPDDQTQLLRQHNAKR